MIRYFHMHFIWINIIFIIEISFPNYDSSGNRSALVQVLAWPGTQPSSAPMLTKIHDAMWRRHLMLIVLRHLSSPNHNAGPIFYALLRITREQDIRREDVWYHEYVKSPLTDQELLTRSDIATETGAPLWWYKWCHLSWRIVLPALPSHTGFMRSPFMNLVECRVIYIPTHMYVYTKELHLQCWVHKFVMMTSSNGNILRVTGHWCGEFTGHRWIPRTKASDAELWCFLWSAPD